MTVGAVLCGADGFTPETKGRHVRANAAQAGNRLNYFPIHLANFVDDFRGDVAGLAIFSVGGLPFPGDEENG